MFMPVISFIGAEAVVTPLEFLGFPAMEKKRVRKRYRNASLDLQLRKARTRAEARILLAAKKAVAVPSVLFVGEDRLILEKVDGALFSKLPGAELAKNLAKSAKNLALLHSAGIVHGDYTVSNQILQPSGVLAVIDFGFAKISNAPEERALDVLTMIKSLPTRQAQKFVSEYAGFSKNKNIQAQVNEILSRARYATQQGS